MKILAFDASTEQCAVALIDGNRRHEHVEHAGQKHSELLLPMIEALLNDGGVRLDQLDGIAFGAGPGSFTGLRIACGVAQGLGLGSGRRLIGICSLEAIAETLWQRDGATRIISAIDARMHEAYVGAYEREADQWRVVMEPIVVKPADMPLPEGHDWIGAGNAFAAYPSLCERLAGCLVRCVTDVSPSAVAIGTLAQTRFAQGMGVTAEAATPFYVRHRVALTMAERSAGVPR